jgi:hypothetical protein
MNVFWLSTEIYNLYTVILFYLIMVSQLFSFNFCFLLFLLFVIPTDVDISVHTVQYIQIMGIMKL